VAAGIVDELEPVEIEQQTSWPTPSPRGIERRLEPPLELRALTRPVSASWLA
jgi:hypothetical protein